MQSKLSPILAAALISAGTTLAQSNISSVLDGSGGLASGGGMTNISAAGQPGGISVSSDGALVNYAGFLNTFAMRPTLDTDSDGIIDEYDTDNDNDQLADLDEITGSGFSPGTSTDVNNPDTDADGTTDGGEAIAGTDPTDLNANLRIVDMRSSPGQVEFDYLARGGASQGKTYVVYGKDRAGQILTAKIFTNQTPASGSAPWYVVTNTHTEAIAASSTGMFFTVEAIQ